MNGASIVIGLIFGLIWGAVCSYIASKMKANQGLAFFLGLIFGLFAIAGYGIALANYRGREQQNGIKETPDSKSD